ncbi:MAG: RING finger protein [Candidatus Heimdallarchaeaceae archaeon]
MIVRCEICGSREINPKYISARSKRFYCSKDCWLIGTKNNSLLAGIILTAIPAVGGIFLSILMASMGENEFLIVTIIFTFSGIPIGGIFIYNAIKGKKLTKERGILEEEKKFSCLFCGQEYEKRVYGAPTKCSNCGEESPFCDICYDYIFLGKPVYKINDCGHIFHKEHLLDYIEHNETCPKCKEKITSIDLMTDQLRVNTGKK